MHPNKYPRFDVGNCLSHDVDVWTKFGPLLTAQYQHSNVPAIKVLLVLHVAVRGDQDIEACQLCGGEEVTVL